MLPNLLHWLRPPTAEEASARVKNVQPTAPGILAQITETMGTIATAIGRTFGTVATAPLAAAEVPLNLAATGIETAAMPVRYISTLANRTRTKLYNLLGGHWFKK